MADNQEASSDNPLSGPKLVAPRARHNYNPITELATSPIQSTSSSPPPAASSPFFSPLYSIPQRQTSPSPASQIVKPPSRTSLRSPRPENKTPTPSDLSLFESHCKSFFGLIITGNAQDGNEELNLISDLDINDDEKLELESRQKLSQSFIDKVLSNCPPSHRAAYNRIQSKVRQLYHSQAELSRQKSLNRLIKSIQPNSKLTSFSQNHLHSLPSRIERIHLLREFLSKHCSKNKVGIHPFLASLKLFFNLQRKSSTSGGGGPISLVWRMDDAVLMETGGEVFMKESIELLKGVLGFTENPINPSTSGFNPEEDPFKDHQNISQNSNNLDSINKRSSLMGGPGTSAPGFSNSPPTYLRYWYLPEHLSNPELYYLSREIPKYVVSIKNPPKLKSVSDKELSSSGSPSRLEEGRNRSNSNGIYTLSSNDQENMVPNSISGSSLNSVSRSSGSRRHSAEKEFADLPTGIVLRGDPIDHRRDKGWKGTLIQRFLIWLRSLFAK